MKTWAIDVWPNQLSHWPTDGNMSLFAQKNTFIILWQQFNIINQISKQYI